MGCRVFSNAKAGPINRPAVPILRVQVIPKRTFSVSWAYEGQQALTRSVSCKAAPSDVSTGIFPAGKKQAKVEIPALWIVVEVQEVLENGFEGAIDDAIASGATTVVLRDTKSGGADLFRATSTIKDAVRDRVALLIEDRADIATACQIDGVVLTDQGLPIAAARQILADASYLVGRYASDPVSAAAAAKEGANFLILQPPRADAPFPPSTLPAIAESQTSGLQIPLLLSSSAIAPDDLPSWLSHGPDGVCGPLSSLPALAAAAPAPPSPSAPPIPTLLEAIKTRGVAPVASSPPSDGTYVHPSTHSGLLTSLLTGSALDTLLSREKGVMQDILDFLAAAVPDMSERRLLVDALAGLDEPFLLVVVGEFNSGKSSVINALLGSKFLEEGILPTTNEISILRHTELEASTERTEDGLFVRYLPSPLLQRLNVVDTPGTNVIVDRQQRLTEEFVPRSDLVLFIMSADRPFTESEVNFLRYIKQWGKKVVFVLNKVDILESQADVTQVVSFVADNAQSLLGVDKATVLPVSARLALQAKLDVGSGQHGGVLESVDVTEGLAPDSRWQSSRFLELEQFMLGFLTGAVTSTTAGGEFASEAESSEDGEEAGSESTRLKLQTPIFVAEALLAAAARQLDIELKACEQEVSSVEGVGRQLARFGDSMRADGEAQRAHMRQLLSKEALRAEAAVSTTLQLSNVGELSGYVLGSNASKPSSLPVAQALTLKGQSSMLSQVEEAVAEHAAWVEANGSKQLQSYILFVNQRLAQAAAGAEDAKLGAFEGQRPASLDVIQGIAGDDATEELEQRVRQVVMETTSSAGGAIGVGAILTTVLPSTLEDLLALTLAGAVSYISFLNWPIKRADIKGEIGQKYDHIAQQLDAELVRELDHGLDKLTSTVQDMVSPLLEMAQAELAIVKGRQDRLAELQDALDGLRSETSRL